MTAMRGALVVLLLVTLPAEAGKRGRAPKVPWPAASATIEQPEAIAPFLEALRATDYGMPEHPVRISFLGDSVTADDHIVERLRAILGARFGQGGPGFVHPIKLSMSFNHGVSRFGGRGWFASGVANPPPPDRLLGFGGAYAETKSGGTLTFKPKRAATSADIYYLEQPRGGVLEVTLNGEKQTITTAHEVKRAGFTRVESDTPIRSLVIRARGRARIFGVDFENDRGVVVDNLGVKNATAKHWGKIRPDHWQKQIEHRAPELFVIFLGTNEASRLGGKSLRGYDEMVGNLLAPIRAAGSSCLVMSVFDQVDLSQPKLPQRRPIEGVVEEQRAAAAAHGCAFWDAYRWMGGARSSVAWRNRRWMSGDFEHPTKAGARRIADALARGLLREYYELLTAPARPQRRS